MVNTKMIISAVAGLFTGSAITYIFAKTHYEKIMRQNEMKTRMDIIKASKKIEQKRADTQVATDILNNIENAPPKPEINNLAIKQPDTAKEMFSQKEIDEYADYTSAYGNAEPPKTVKENVMHNDSTRQIISGPYPISPEEYGEILDYDQIELTYYSDGILIDENGDIMEPYKLSSTIGEDFKDAFGDYSEDGAWFRNDDTKREYYVEKCMEPYYGG